MFDLASRDSEQRAARQAGSPILGSRCRGGLFSLFPAAADAASLQISAVAGAIAGLASAVVSNPADVPPRKGRVAGDCQ